MNPALPLKHFVPDSEARVMPDGRVYVYGSYDISGNNSYCSSVLHVFSSDNLIDWIDHGVSFSSAFIPWTSDDSLLYAPDCIYCGGKYYLYFCLSDNTEGVAVADQPYGPFTDPTPIKHASGDGIDPAIFIDDDGQAYYYWGQFSLRCAKMNPDMRTLDPSTINKSLIDEKRHGFHEGASVRKHNGIYYLVYTCISRGKATCLAYATSDHLMGPFTYRGIIIDNIGVDPDTWNNHGSIECVGGKWYVFYHRSSQNSKFNRRLSIEPIEILKDGAIPEVVPTTQGVSAPIPVSSEIMASSACRLGGWGSYACIGPDPKSITEEAIVGIHTDGWAVYRYLDFTDQYTTVFIEYESDAPGSIEVSSDDDMISTLSLSKTDGSSITASSPAKKVSGVHTLYIKWHFTNGSNAVIRKIHFH